MVKKRGKKVKGFDATKTQTLDVFAVFKERRNMNLNLSERLNRVADGIQMEQRAERLTRFVAGFLIWGGTVLLIRKQRPEWQKGKLNGIGGHIEAGETARQAMVREFKEEAGLEINEWKLFAELYGDNWSVSFFVCHPYDMVNPHWSIKAQTDEELEWHPVSDLKFLKANALTNLTWLIPMAMYDESNWPYMIKERAQ